VFQNSTKHQSPAPNSMMNMVWDFHKGNIMKFKYLKEHLKKMSNIENLNLKKELLGGKGKIRKKSETDKEFVKQGILW